MIISGILTLIFLVIFLASYLTDSRRIINGFLFNVFFCSFIIFLCYLGFSSDLIIVRLFAIVPIVILVFILTFGLSTICVGLFLNARILLKRESRRFANSLTLISGIFLLLFILFRLVNPMRFLPYYFEPLYTGGFLYHCVFLFTLN